MAIQMNLEMVTGVILPKAYVRITEGILSLDRGMAFITVQTYASKEARDARKPAVLVHEAKCTYEGSQPLRNAKYTISIKNAEVGSGQEIKVVNDSEEIALKEGTNITTDGTLGTYTQSIVDKLNSLDYNLSLDFLATYISEGLIEVTAKEDGVKIGKEGNSLLISGDAIDTVQVVEGNDELLSDFEKYFGVEVMNLEGNNVIKQAYEFIKGLPEYQNGMDIL